MPSSAYYLIEWSTNPVPLAPARHMLDTVAFGSLLFHKEKSALITHMDLAHMDFAHRISGLGSIAHVHLAHILHFDILLDIFYIHCIFLRLFS